MKKYIILAAALATMASCTKNASLEVAPAVEDDAIGFSAYSGTAATKGTVVETTDVIATDKGIGVFAFYQPANGTSKQYFNTTKFASPDFMYDTRVYPNNITSTAPITVDYWTYSPKKYWPNNTGDLISFFAYAPYDENKTWEDLGFKTDVNATKLTASFPVYTEKTAMEDYVFATPALNKSKQNIGGAKINFDFKHIMSRVAINIGAIIDATGTAPEAFPQPDAAGTGTIITVESIEFQNIAESYDYTYIIETGKETWKENGSQNLLLTADDFQNYTSDKWVKAKDKESDPMPWLPLLAKEESKAGYLFIAPQDLTNANLVITYTVETKNAKNPADNSTIKNVITKPVNVNFLSGKAYTLNLLIGMKTVEISASVTDWADGDPATTQINVPANRTLIYPESNTLGIDIDGVIWAPVNCGYDATNYPYGKLYQWGRKYGQGESDTIAPSAMSKSDDTETNKDIFGQYNDTNYNWFSGILDNTLWKGSTKGASDPCPAGWRVPTKAEFEALIGSNNSPSIVSVGGQNGCYFNGTASASSGVFLPAAGYRNYYNGSVLYRTGNPTDEGLYWSSSVDGGNSWYFQFHDTNAHLNSNYRANGYSVRCVAE